MAKSNERGVEDFAGGRKGRIESAIPMVLTAVLAELGELRAPWSRSVATHQQLACFA
jgi:hypothetical protein